MKWLGRNMTKVYQETKEGETRREKRRNEGREEKLTERIEIKKRKT